MIGRRLGRYEIVERLGAGGMGEVYRARDPLLERDVALKCLHAKFSADPERVARFEREAKAVAALNHPNIVTLFSIEEAEGIRFLTMERIEGESIDRLLSTGDQAASRVFEIAIGIAEALAAAHEKGIVHRDLKPANVMLTHDGRVKVLDFGLAKLVSESETSQEFELVNDTETQRFSITHAGKILGTVPYMAPEQLRGEPVDARTDIFALGILLYELAAGRRPFQGTSTSEIAASILRDVPIPLGALREDLPSAFRDTVSRCLHKDPCDRYQTSREMLSSLQGVLRTVEISRIQPFLSSSSPAPRGLPSIAVLPFVNMSRDEENEYFADGLSEELLNVLTKVRGLHVAARTSSFHFKGRTGDVGEIGAQLRVATVLEGSVRKSGDRVRITTQLVNVSDGYHLWSETYDRRLDDVLAVQDEIARCVVNELRGRLLGVVADSGARAATVAEVRQAIRGRGASAEAYRLYLQAQYFTGRHTRSDLEKAVRHYRAALDVDAQYALAWAGLSNAYALQGGMVWLPLREAYSLAREAAERALQLEPNLPEALVAMGRVRLDHDWEWNHARACLLRAVELAPGDANAVLAAGALAAALGELDEAVAFGRRAVALDPLSVPAHIALAWRCHRSGRLAEAEAAAEQALQLNVDATWPHHLLGLVRLAENREAEALGEFQAEPHEALRLLGEVVAHHAQGDSSRSDAALKVLLERHRDGWAVQIAAAYAFRGAHDKAFDWLGRAFDQRDSGLPEIKTDPLLIGLHKDPRWDTLLRRLGLVDDTIQESPTRAA